MNNTIKKMIVGIPNYLFAFFIILFSLSNLLFTYVNDDSVPFISNLSIIHYIFVFIFILLMIKYITKTNIKCMKIILYLFTIILGMYWILTNQLEILDNGDAYNCYNAAELLSKNDYSGFAYKSYINMYPHNIPIVMYFFIIIKLFGSYSLLVIRFINLLFVLLGYIYIIKITKLLFNNDTITKLSIILLFFFTQFIFHSFIIYSFVISYSLTIISIYYFLLYYKNKNNKYLLVSLLLICISSILKNNSLIVLVAISIYIILDVLEYKRYKSLLYTLIFIIGLTIINISCIKYWENKIDISYDNKLPKQAWLVYGINSDPIKPGTYVPYIEKFHIENDFLTMYTNLEINYYLDYYLDYLLESPNNLLDYYSRKFIKTYAEPSFDSTYAYAIDNTNKLNVNIKEGLIFSYINEFWNIGMSILSIGLLLFMKYYKNKDLNILFIGVIVLGGMLFHLIWETKSIYVYMYVIILIPYASYGINKLISRED